MRKIKEILRLRFERGLSARQIAQCCGIARSTVAEYLCRFEQAGLTWPAAAESDETSVERRLFPPPPTLSASERVTPDFAYVHRELRRKGVTLMLLWHEYKAAHPPGFQYSWFCEAYRCWASRCDVAMRQVHRGGEKLFVDYAGHTAEVVDRHTGQVRTAQIFVAVQGASNYTYAEATWTQQLPDWIGSHVRAFAFFGGVPEIVVPDNLKAGVSRAHRYEPELNPTYADLARHYGVAVIPARSRRPRDKAKVEVAVQVVERWILAALRNRRFFSLAELNAAITELLDRLNRRAFRKLPGCRRELFERLDRPALQRLPSTPYEYAEWKRARVHIDYHVEVEGHYYSVPYQLVKKPIEVRLTEQVIECFHKGERVASHRRSTLHGHHTTIAEHMPRAHRHYAEWTPRRLITWAEKTGPATAGVIAAILERRAHAQQGFRSALGIMRLAKGYGEERLEAACRRALRLGAFSYKSIESILRRGLDATPAPERAPTEPAPIEHANLRGPDYYH